MRYEASRVEASAWPICSAAWNSNLPAFERFVQIVDGKRDVRHASDNLRHVAMWLEPDPFDSVRTRFKTAHVNPKVREMMLLGPRLRMRNPEVVIPVKAS